MKFTTNPAYIVTLEFPVRYDQEQCKSWVRDRYRWLHNNALFPYQAYFIRQAIEITQEMIRDGETTGDVFTEVWVINFSDPNDAMMFKLAFGGI